MKKILSVILFAALLEFFGYMPKSTVKTYSEVGIEVVQLHPEPIVKKGDPGREDYNLALKAAPVRK